MLAVIGGTGFYKLDGVEVIDQVVVPTPFGAPSAPLVRAKFGAAPLVFLPRHGAKHEFLPHEINYRANVYALKKLGVRQAISISAVGSLRAEIAPGHFALPSQYIDWTRGRRATSFFGEGLAAHVSMARPVCPNLSVALAQAAVSQPDLVLHTDKTYICVEGPRFGTQAESHVLRGMGGDLVGMTNLPEAFLMREAQVCYASLCIATDYDAWQDDPSAHADTAAIIQQYGRSLGQAQALLRTLLAAPLPSESDLCRTALAGAVMTPEEARLPAARELLAVLEA